MRPTFALRVFLSAGLFSGVLITGTARASSLTGSVYINTSAAGDATPANVPSGAPAATFTVGDNLDFSSYAGTGNGGAAYTVGSFLATGGATNVTGSAATLANTLDNTLINFVGTIAVTNGEVFDVEHDDGLTLVIDGDTVISAPGPTSATPSSGTYTGPSGTYGFQLVYGEVDGAPAVLDIDLPTAASTTPEPSSLLLLSTGLVGAGMMMKKRLLGKV